MTDVIKTDDLKIQLINIARQKYEGFMNEISSFPLHPNFQNNVMHYFQTGFLYLREAIALAEIVAKVANTDDKADGEKTPETV